VINSRLNLFKNCQIFLNFSLSDFFLGDEDNNYLNIFVFVFHKFMTSFWFLSWPNMHHRHNRHAVGLRELMFLSKGIYYLVQPAVLFGCTLLSCGIITHHPGDFHRCMFDQALSCCMRRYCFCIFPSNRLRSMYCFAVGLSFYSWSRWTISTKTSRYLVFFFLEKLKGFPTYFTYLTR